MMKIFLYIFIIATFFSCSPISKEKSVETDTITENTTIKNSTFDSCFTEPNLNIVQSVIGCSKGYYKVISDIYVLGISTNIEVDYNNCIELTNDTMVQSFKAELLIFEKGKASLSNICTDLIMTNAPKPMKTLNECYGKITIGNSYPTDFLVGEMPKMTIRVDYLIFIDNQTGNKIKIENELFWKVLNIGTPG